MKKNNQWLLFVLISFLVLIMIAFYASTNKYAKPKLSGNIQITTSFYPLFFLTSEIAGTKADVYTITPNGAEPHDYEPTAQDIARIENSNLLVLNGASLESWGDRIQNDLENKSVFIIKAGENLATQTIEEGDKKIKDPHVWLSPILAKQMMNRILQGLIKIDPENKNYYLKNANSLQIKLDDLDSEYKTSLSSCNKKDLITSHSAFGYLASTYNLHQVSISGLSPDEEPSTKQLTKIADFAKQNNVQYIFFESLVSPKLSETIAHEVGAQTLVLDPLEGISQDDMKSGKNYFTIMKDNLTNLKIALECK